MTKPLSITFIVPVYNERDTLARLTESIGVHATSWPHEILFVDDGSTDGSAEVLDALCDDNDTVGLIRFRQNAGKTQALAAGFAHARGDVFVTMDADLQDDPAELANLLGKLGEGHDLVCGWKADRQDPWHKTLPSRVYNAYIAWTFGLRLHDINTGFKAMRAEVAQSVPLFGDMHRLIPIFARHAGFDVAEVAVRHHPRRHGESKYGLERYAHGMRDIARARLLTRFGGSVAPYVRRALLWSIVGIVLSLILAALPPGIAGAPAVLYWLVVAVPIVLTVPIVVHCLHMIRIGPSVVRRAQDTTIHPELEVVHLPRATDVADRHAPQPDIQ